MKTFKEFINESKMKVGQMLIVNSDKTIDNGPWEQPISNVSNNIVEVNYNGETYTFNKKQLKYSNNCWILIESEVPSNTTSNIANPESRISKVKKEKYEDYEYFELDEDTSD